jgi:hypothetical protein
MLRMRFFGHFYKADYSGGDRKFWGDLDFGPGPPGFELLSGSFRSYFRGRLGATFGVV